MAFLNERTEKTKKIIHLLVTEFCDRNCKYCCNKQYNMDEIPKVTHEELLEAEALFLTGGEPFTYTQPEKIAQYYKLKYPNIKEVYVYTNAIELSCYLYERDSNFNMFHNLLEGIDGVTISIKNINDAQVFEYHLKKDENIIKLKSNWLYVFDNLYPISDIEGFKVTKREWQADFIPADDSIFRRI